MDQALRQELLDFCKEIAPEAEYVFMDPKEAIFEECVKMSCFYCGKYGRNWRCPPNIPQIDYPKMFSEYDEGLFVLLTYDAPGKAQFEATKNEYSIMIHKILLQIEKWFYDHNSSTAISFGADSCKLCKGGCGKEQCNNPYMSRSPIEATGINVVKTATKFGINMHFPDNEKYTRMGLVIWQDPNSATEVLE